MIICRTISLLLFPFLVFCGCQQETVKEESDTNATAGVVFEQVWQTDSVFQTPESVVFDPLRNKLYVSNIVGSPEKKDGEGFLSIVDMNGKVEQVRWIEGFNAPKGLYIHDDLLYVADIDQLVVISILEGTILKKMGIPQARFLNAITYLPGQEKFLITDTYINRIYWVDADGQIGVWLEEEALSNPNGIFYHNESLLVASFKGQQVLSIDPKTLNIQPRVQGIGAGDGIIITATGDTIVSDWGGKVFRLENGEPSLLVDLSTFNENAADIEWAEEPGLLLVPTFFGNRVRAYRLSDQ